jgi:hypothetical protein
MKLNLWLLLLGFFILLSIATTDGFQEDCNEPAPIPRVCKGSGSTFDKCKEFNASMEKWHLTQKKNCEKKEAAATTLFNKYKEDIVSKCSPIPDLRCEDESKAEGKAEGKGCPPIPDKLCEGQIVEELQRDQDLHNDLYNVTRPGDSDYTLRSNNNKCKYQFTENGPIYVHEDGQGDLDNYYDPPLMESSDTDIREYGESESNRLLNKYKHSLSHPNIVSGFNYYLDPVGEDVSDIQRKKNQEVNPCDGSIYPPALENSRVIPQLVTKGKSKEKSKEIPCSEPLLPWLQGQQIGDDRHYCKEQEVPCKKCGILQDTDIYHATIDGPNRVPVGMRSSHQWMGLG